MRTYTPICRDIYIEICIEHLLFGFRLGLGGRVWCCIAVPILVDISSCASVMKLSWGRSCHPTNQYDT